MGISWQQLLIILLIALLIFGAKKLRNVGSDIGAAVRGFKKAMNEGDEEERRGELKHQGPDADFDNSRDPSRTDTSSADRDKNA